MDARPNDLREQLDRHLASPHQSWLFGAGISKNANIPLMIPLTERVLSFERESAHKTVLDALRAELPENAHVEHLLSHLGDYAALAERSRNKKTRVADAEVSLADLSAAHAKLLSDIARIIRWGYQPETKASGDVRQAITNVAEHARFVSVLFNTTQAGLRERRGPVHLFTTNYDTLLEDALALAGVPCWDGFSGGAVAFRSHRFGDSIDASGHRAVLVKLHGSIDWQQGDDGHVWRVRDGDTYPTTASRVLIYPQATKYRATQRDPFAAQFELFRRALNSPSDNTFAVCGYSFGDEHINQEIELAMARPESRTTLLAFCVEGSTALPETLSRWRASRWAERLFCITERGLYVGDKGPYFAPKEGETHDWWTFDGVTRLLRDGAEGCIR